MTWELTWLLNLLVAGLELAAAFQVGRWMRRSGPRGLGWILAALVVLAAVRLKVVLALAMPGYPLEYALWMDVYGGNGDKLIAWPLWAIGVVRLVRSWRIFLEDRRVD